MALQLPFKAIDEGGISATNFKSQKESPAGIEDRVNEHPTTSSGAPGGNLACITPWLNQRDPDPGGVSKHHDATEIVDNDRINIGNTNTSTTIEAQSERAQAPVDGVAAIPGDKTEASNTHVDNTVIPGQGLDTTNMSAQDQCLKNTGVDAEQGKPAKSKGCVPVGNNGALTSGKALARKLRKEADGERKMRPPSRGGLVLWKHSDRVDTEQEEDEDSSSFDVIVTNKKLRGATFSGHVEANKEEDGGWEATSSGAAGQLTDASVSTCQEP